MQCGALDPCSSPLVPGPLWGKKWMISAWGEQCACVCMRESRRHMQVPSRVYRWCTPPASKGSCLAWLCQGSPCLRTGALLPENGRNLPVSRVSKRPPRSKTRGEPAWGGCLARTAENSGPDPKPIKTNGKPPTSCRDTWHHSPPDTAHLQLSPEKLHIPTQSMS